MITVPNRSWMLYNKIDGVSAKVDLQSQTATIFYDREINDNELYQAVKSAGYHIQSISCS